MNQNRWWRFERCHWWFRGKEKIEVNSRQYSKTHPTTNHSPKTMSHFQNNSRGIFSCRWIDRSVWFRYSSLLAPHGNLSFQWHSLYAVRLGIFCFCQTNASALQQYGSVISFIGFHSAEDQSCHDGHKSLLPMFFYRDGSSCRRCRNDPMDLRQHQIKPLFAGSAKESPGSGKVVVCRGENHAGRNNSGRGETRGRRRNTTSGLLVAFELLFDDRCNCCGRPKNNCWWRQGGIQFVPISLCHSTLFCQGTSMFERKCTFDCSFRWCHGCKMVYSDRDLWSRLFRTYHRSSWEGGRVEWFGSSRCLDDDKNEKWQYEE